MCCVDSGEQLRWKTTCRPTRTTTSWPSTRASARAPARAPSRASSFTGMYRGNVSRECVMGMYKGAGTRSKPSFFIHGNMSRECVTGMCKGAGTRSKPSFILSGDYADTGVRRIFDGKRKVRSLVTRFLVGVAEHCDWRVCLLHMSLRTHISRIMCPNFAISCMRVTVAMISLSFDSAF